MPRIKQNATKYAMVDLSSHMKGRIKDAGITQEELGFSLKKSQQSVSRLLNHPEKMPLGLLRQVCSLVEIDPATVTKAAWCEKK